MPGLPSFTALAAAPDPRLDLLALALAAEFREVDADGALARLDELGAEAARATGEAAGSPPAEARVIVELLGGRHGFVGNVDEYDHPDNSMLDLVLRRRRGLPILLSVVYAEVGRRAGVPIAGVGLPGHFVVGHFGVDPPLLIDPFAGGAGVNGDVPPALARAWTPAEIAMRMLNNLVGSYERRGNLGAALRAAELRLELPAGAALRDSLQAELRAMRARLN